MYLKTIKMTWGLTINVHASDTQISSIDILFPAFHYATLPILCEMAYAPNLEASSSFTAGHTLLMVLHMIKDISCR
jgi:hypothetical protein